MSVESLINKCTYDTDGSTKIWDYTFPIISSTDIQVWVVSPAGISTQITTNFSVNTTALQVTYPVTGSALADDGSKVILLRVVPINQELVLTTQGPFPAASLNSGYDKVTMIAQQLQEQISRAIVADVGTTTTPADFLVALDAAVTEAQAAQAAAVLAEMGAQTAEDGAQAAQAAAEAAASAFTKATVTEAQAGVEDTHFMTPSKTKNAIDALQRAFATVTEAQTGTDNTKDMSPLRVAQAITALAAGSHYYVGFYNRDVSVADGDVAITGVGFTPKVIILLGSAAGVKGNCYGVAIANPGKCIGVYSDGTTNQFDHLGMINMSLGPTKSIYVDLKTFDAAGFTLTFTKVNSSTGNGYFVYLLIG